MAGSLNVPFEATRVVLKLLRWHHALSPMAYILNAGR